MNDEEENRIYCQETFSDSKAGEGWVNAACLVTGRTTLAQESKKKTATNTVVTFVRISRKGDWHYCTTVPYIISS
jgi:hypothetical protein